jgi:hypothetical protein
VRTRLGRSLWLSRAGARIGSCQELRFLAWVWALTPKSPSGVPPAIMNSKRPFDGFEIIRA